MHGRQIVDHLLSWGEFVLFEMPVSAEDQSQLSPVTADIQLRLLLFTDERLAHRSEIKRVQDYLERLRQETDFSLEIINIKD